MDATSEANVEMDHGIPLLILKLKPSSQPTITEEDSFLSESGSTYGELDETEPPHDFITEDDITQYLKQFAN